MEPPVSWPSDKTRIIQYSPHWPSKLSGAVARLFQRKILISLTSVYWVTRKNSVLSGWEFCQQFPHWNNNIWPPGWLTGQTKSCENYFRQILPHQSPVSKLYGRVKSGRRQDRQGRPGLSGILIANYSLDRIKNKNKMNTDILRWLYNVPFSSREKNYRGEIWHGRFLRCRTKKKHFYQWDRSTIQSFIRKYLSSLSINPQPSLSVEYK